MDAPFEKVTSTVKEVKKKPYIIVVVGIGLILIFFLLNRGKSSSTQTNTTSDTKAVSTEDLSNVVTSFNQSLSDMSQTFGDTLSDYEKSNAETIKALRDTITDSAKNESTMFNQINTTVSDLTSRVQTIQGYTDINGTNGDYPNNKKPSAADMAKAIHQKQIDATLSVLKLQEDYKKAAADGKSPVELAKIHAQADAVAYDAGLQTSPTTTDGSQRKMVYE